MVSRELDDLGRRELLELLLAYEDYVRSGVAEGRWSDGSAPLTVSEFLFRGGQADDAPAPEASGPDDAWIAADGESFRRFFEDDATWRGDGVIFNLDIRINDRPLDPIKPEHMQIGALMAGDQVTICDGFIERADERVSLQAAFVRWMSGQ